MARKSRAYSLESNFDPGPPGSWALRANCGGTPPALLDFFGKTRVDWGTSKGICKGCPVRRDCLEYALNARMVHGVWGGLDPLELRFILGRDATGELWAYAKALVKCPYCRGRTETTDLTEESVSRKCEQCGFEWQRAERKKPKRKRRVQITQQRVGSGLTQ